MAWVLEDVLPRIMNAGDDGLTRGQIEKKLAKQHRDKLPETLKSLISTNEIRSPIKYGNSQFYFAVGRGPSADVTCKVVSKLVLDSRMKLLSLAALRKKVSGLKGKFLADGIKLAVTGQKTIIELTCGTSKYYLHREVAQEYFGLSSGDGASDAMPVALPQHAELTLRDVRPVFQQLKAEQGGLGTIDIYDLIKALGVPKGTMHRFLERELKAGHLTIHPTTTVQLKPEVIDAGMRLPGFPEPFVTVALKDE